MSNSRTGSGRRWRPLPVPPRRDCSTPSASVAASAASGSLQRWVRPPPWPRSARCWPFSSPLGLRPRDPEAAVRRCRTGTVPGSGLGGLHLTSRRRHRGRCWARATPPKAAGAGIGLENSGASGRAPSSTFISAKPRAGAQVSRRAGSAAPSTPTAMAIAVSNGHTAIITAGPATHARFRFPGQLPLGNAPYTMTDKHFAGLTLSGCGSSTIGTGIPQICAPGLTISWEGCVTDLRGCIPVEVRTTPHGTPVRVMITTLAAPR